MKLYRLSVGDYDGSTEYLLTHDNKTEDEFREDCHAAIRTTAEDVIKESDGAVWASDWIRKVVETLKIQGYGVPEFGGHFEMSDELITYWQEGSAWCNVVGDEIYGKAVKMAFEYAIQSPSDKYFTLLSESIYHLSTCPELAKRWKEQRWSFSKKYQKEYKYLQTLTPCPVCLKETNDV